MFKQVQNVIEHPEDIPSVPKGLKEYLQVRYSHNYMVITGQWKQLLDMGYSESFAAGVIHGLYIAGHILDEIEAHKDRLKDEANLSLI